MSRSRNIKPGFFKNADLAEVSIQARLLFIGLWTIADRDGRLLDRPKQIKMEIFPADNFDCNELLNELVKIEMIDRYSLESGSYIQVINFSKHQNPHKAEKESTIPPNENTGKHHASTMQTPCKHHASTVLARLIPDSLNLIPDSLNLIPEKETCQIENPKETKKPKLSVTATSECLEVFEFWKETMNKPRAKLDDKRKKFITNALKLGFSVEDLNLAILGCSLDSWYMGSNDNNKSYNDIQHCLKDASKIESMIDNAAKQSKPTKQYKVWNNDEQ